MSPRSTASLGISVLAILLSACDPRTPASVGSAPSPTVSDNSSRKPMDRSPSEQEIRDAVRTSNCELVTIKSVNWPDDSYTIPANHADAKVLYEADCKSEDGSRVYRVTFQAQFAAATSVNTGFSTRFWELKHNQPMKQPDAIAQSSEVASSATPALPASLTGSPQCDALMEQVRRDVVPCVEKIDGAAARRIQYWHDVTAQEFQWRGGNGNKAFDEMARDQRCMESWRISVARDFGGSPYKACAPQ